MSADVVFQVIVKIIKFETQSYGLKFWFKKSVSLNKKSLPLEVLRRASLSLNVGWKYFGKKPTDSMGDFYAKNIHIRGD